MVTKVIDADGTVVHDCDAGQCAVSWDGYVIATGDPAEGRTDPDPGVWQIDGNTARVKTE